MALAAAWPPRKVNRHIRQRAHYVDIIFGPQTLHRLPEMINAVRGNRSPVVDISFPEIEKFDRLPEPRAGRPDRLVSIMEVATNTAPTVWCRTPAEKRSAVRATISCLKSPRLAAQGVREVNLLGQNVNAWRGENYDGTIGSQGRSAASGRRHRRHDRIRFTTSHLIEFTDDIIEVYRDTPELVSASCTCRCRAVL